MNILLKNKPIVVALNGSGGVGKTTFASYCERYCDSYNFSSVDCIKEAAKSLGCDIQSKTDKGRAFLSELTKLSDEYFGHRKIYIAETIKLCISDDVVFIDVREPWLIQWLKDEFEAITLIVTNSSVDAIRSNDSDANVNKFNYDYEVVNNGSLDELDRKAEYFIKTIIT